MSENIEYTNEELNMLILKNTLKMLYIRNLINYDDIENYLSHVNKNKYIFEIKLKNKSIYSIYLLNIPITTITNGSSLDEYLSENININKILIAKSVSKKVVKQLYQQYQNVEFFFDYEMLEDKSEIIFIPKHRILSEEEINNLNINVNLLSYIKLFDPMTRYHNGKVGDIFEITRMSSISGYSIEYRKVIISSSDIIFPN